MWKFIKVNMEVQEHTIILLNLHCNMLFWYYKTHLLWKKLNTRLLIMDISKHYLYYAPVSLVEHSQDNSNEVYISQLLPFIYSVTTVYKQSVETQRDITAFRTSSGFLWWEISLIIF